MKFFPFALLALLACLPLRADEWLQNGNFSEGLSHWYGDGEMAADAAKRAKEQSDPLSTAPPPSIVDNPGVVIQLKSASWSKLTQEFTTDTLSMDLTVNFIASADCAFTDKDTAYTDIFKSLGFRNYMPKKIATGAWSVLLTDKGTNWCFYSSQMPKLNPGSPTPQSFQTSFSGAGEKMKPDLHKTITIAFPPGQGSITLTLVSLKSSDSGPGGDSH